VYLFSSFLPPSFLYPPVTLVLSFSPHLGCAPKPTWFWAFSTTFGHHSKQEKLRRGEVPRPCQNNKVDLVTSVQLNSLLMAAKLTWKKIDA